jgi:hypothetical protein
MGDVEHVRRVSLAKAQYRHEVQAKEGEMREIVLSQGFGSEVGVEEAQALQAASALAETAQTGKPDALVGAGDDEADGAFAVNQEADLAADFPGEGGHVPGELGCDGEFRGDSSAVEVFELADLEGLESSGVSEELFHGTPLRDESAL